MADLEAGFTVKEMIIRLDAKMDHVIADHEARLRLLEKVDNQNSGERGFKRWLSPFVVACVGALWWLPHYVH